MARKVDRLTDRTIEAKKAKGYYADGNGLYLQVSNSGAKSWIFRFKRDGKARDMGLGGYPAVSLAKAREKAQEAREQRDDDKDPIAERAAVALQKRLAEARTITFKKCAEDFIEANEAGWKNAKHRQQWANTLETYAYPILGDVPVADIDTALVRKVVQPIWATRTVTATRVRGRIESVLAWATVMHFRSGANPALWRGHLDKLLPKPSKVRKPVPHPALRHADMPAFMARLRAKQSMAALALEFTILTATRTKEALEAPFDEFDLAAKVWTIPAERMKAEKEHKVPLSNRAVAIVKKMAATRTNEFVFPGRKRGEPLSETAMLMLLWNIHPGITVHGFRSTFKDWSSEMTTFPDHVSEAALAHGSADKVRKAYARSDLFEKRRELMDAWAEYCETRSQRKGAVRRAKPKQPVSRGAGVTAV
jgi:integrase